MTDQDDSVFEIHDPLAEDLTRLVDIWGLATVIHGLKVETQLTAEETQDEDERGLLYLIAAHLDAAWVDAEGGER